MDELISHQLGMAMALCSLGAELTEKHKGLLAKYKDEAELEKEVETFKDHTRRSEEIAKAMGAEDEAKQACEEADQTFRAMHDEFFDTMEQDAVHVLSWMAMSNGGGIAIWGVLEGAADKTGDKDLENLSNEALTFQKDCLEKSQKLLHDIAKQD